MGKIAPRAHAETNFTTLQPLENIAAFPVPAHLVVVHVIRILL